MSLHFGFKYWKEPTPAKIRRVSSALATAGIAGCGFAHCGHHRDHEADSESLKCRSDQAEHEHDRNSKF